MANINRDYLVVLDVKTGNATAPNMYFYNTDKSTSNIYVQLVVKETVVKVTPIENATDFVIVAKIIKPGKALKEMTGVLVNIEEAIYEFDLPTDFTNLSGDYDVEFWVSAKVSDSNETITSSNIMYTVKQSILTELDPSIDDTNDYPLLIALKEELESLKNSGQISHSHENKSVLDGITSAKVTNWDTAYTHSQTAHFSGDYNDLTNKPTIPTNTSDLTNNSGFATETYVTNAIANAQLGGGTVTQVEPEELDMPKVFFYGDALPTTKDDVLLTMDYISNTDKFSSYIKLKCQGTSSMSYAKKNFTINMYSDEARTTKLKKDFKGWGSQSKFCLKANYIDTTHTRNLSGARIAYDMVQSRPDSPFKQQLLQCPRNGAVDGFPIKLYFNGEFYGIYTWNIPKDAWMFNMDKSNSNHMVLCAEQNNNGSTVNDNVLRCEFRKEWDGTDGNSWSIEFGTYSDALKNSFNRCVNFVITATDEEFKANIGDYFDLYSLLDYYCFSYLVAHIDGLGKNMLMATYDGVIWGASLYDMDSIYGANVNGASFKATNIQCPEQYQETNSLLWQRIEQCFATELYARYLELRQGALSLGNIIKHVEEIYDVIPDRVFADEKAKWTDLPQVANNTMTRFRNYMRDRAVYVDAQMQEIGTKVPCTGIVISNDTLSFTTTDTQTLSVVISPDNCTDTVTWSVSPTGVVSVDNGVVTPIANGSCTITATCGTQTATCAVTVSGIEEQPIPNGLLVKLDSSSLTSSSTTWEDLSGNGVNFTLSDGTPNVSDKGLLMTSVKVKGTKAITLNGAFTEYYCVCVKNSSTSAFCSYNINSITRYCANADNGVLKINGYSGNTMTSAAIANPDKLQKIAVVRPSEGDTQVYLNGALQGTYSRGTFECNGNYDLVLGASSYNNFPNVSAYFTLKEFQVFNRALSAEEAIKLTSSMV